MNKREGMWEVLTKKRELHQWRYSSLLSLYKSKRLN